MTGPDVTREATSIGNADGTWSAERPPDGTRDGAGVWRAGVWWADRQPMDEAMTRTHHEPGSAEEAHSRQMRFVKYYEMQQLLMDIAAAAPQDNHAMQFQPRARQILAGSGAGGPGQQIRFDKYLDMQQLLNDIANSDMHTELGEGNAAIPSGQSFWARAKEILAGMERPRSGPRTPLDRAGSRALELEILAMAYRWVGGAQSTSYAPALTLMIEALKAWERANPPEPLDPLLFNR